MNEHNDENYMRWMVRKICKGRSCGMCPLFRYNCSEAPDGNWSEKDKAAIYDAYYKLFGPDIEISTDDWEAVFSRN